MAAGIGRGKLKIGIQLFRRIHGHHYRLAAITEDSATVMIENDFSIDEITMVFHQPIDAIRLATLFVSRERKNDVTIGLESFFLEADQRRRHDGIATLHILRAAAVVKAVFLKENEGIDRPVLAVRFDYIEMSDQQKRLMFSCSAQTNDKIFLAIVRAKNLHVRFRKAGIAKALRHGFGCSSNISHRIRSIDFD